MKVVHSGDVAGLDDLIMSDVTIYGVTSRPSVIIIDPQLEHFDFEYDHASQVKNLNLTT